MCNRISVYQQTWVIRTHLTQPNNDKEAKHQTFGQSLSTRLQHCSVHTVVARVRFRRPTPSIKGEGGLAKVTLATNRTSHHHMETGGGTRKKRKKEWAGSATNCAVPTPVLLIVPHTPPPHHHPTVAAAAARAGTIAVPRGPSPAKMILTQPASC